MTLLSEQILKYIIIIKAKFTSDTCNVLKLCLSSHYLSKLNYDNDIKTVR